MDGIRATPMQYPILGLLADRLKKAQQFAVAPGGYANPPAEILLNLLGVPAIQQTMERVAYGEPLTTGRGMTTRVRPEVAEAAMTLLPAAAGTARVAERGAMAAGRAGERLAERVVPQIMERGGMPAGLLEGMSSRTVSPLTVYHGSPAKFERFDPTKIGSGEGAQAYGYGHYFAESPDVARRYQMGLTQAKGEEVLYKNKPLTDLYSQIENKSMKLSGKAADIENQKLQLVEHMMLDKPPQELIPYAKETGFDKAVIDWLEKDVAKNTQIPGAFYEIDLPDEQIARMLDWDKPLSQQAQAKAVFERIGSEIALPRMQGAEGAGFAYQHLANAVGGPKNAAALLRNEGIPGIRYLDQGSRGAGQGTSNFVVFPGGEDLLTILKRNGGLLGP